MKKVSNNKSFSRSDLVRYKSHNQFNSNTLDRKKRKSSHVTETS